VFPVEKLASVADGFEEHIQVGGITVEGDI
jgi:hypothetical protein